MKTLTTTERQIVRVSLEEIEAKLNALKSTVILTDLELLYFFEEVEAIASLRAKQISLAISEQPKLPSEY